MKRIFYLIGFYGAFVSAALAQGNINVFADTNNNDTLQKLVTIFTEQLKKSTAASFTVQPASSYQGAGIYLGNTTASNQEVKPSTGLLKAGVEAFSIDANEQTVRIMGNSNMAVGHGIFSYLELLGYRYYFANPDWYIVPSKPVLFRKWNIVSSPAFMNRRIWYGYGTGSAVADADYNFWVLANKSGGSMHASYGHAYEDIALRNKEVFLKHLEWFYPVAPKGTIPDDAKFDMTKEELVQVVIRDVEKRIENSLKDRTSDYKMISLAPSDGVGTCNTPACQQLGTPTDRVYYLVNRVARAIQKKYPTTLIGCLAYADYISPPTIKIEPNVFVGITTAFNTSKYTTEELVGKWREKGGVIGIYDYFSWYAWDFDVPGQSLASRTDDIVNSIKRYYAKGVRAYEGESSIGWVSKGLGYYLAARQMWDIHADPVAAKKEFFSLCFGKASGVMERLWSEWEKYSFPTIREGELARWIDYVREAEGTEKRGDVKKRFFQIKSYLHWLALYHNYQVARNEANLLTILNYGYRKLDDGSVSGFPAFWELGNRSGITGMAYAENAKWKNGNSRVTDEEIDRLVTQDRNKLKVSQPVRGFLPARKFTLVPGVDRYNKLVTDTTGIDNAFWYTNELMIEIKNKGQANYLNFKGSILGDSTVKRPIRISIYPLAEGGNISSLPVLLYYEYNAMMVNQRISLATLNPGYYTMIIEDPVRGFRFSFSPAVNYSMAIRPARQVRTLAINYAFIYVPEGVTKFNVMKTAMLQFITPTGRQISFATHEALDLQIDVQKGEQGLWRVKSLYGDLYVEGIPPYLGISPEHMLIPAGVK